MTKAEIESRIHYPQKSEQFTFVAALIEMYIETVNKIFSTKSREEAERLNNYRYALRFAVQSVNKGDYEFLYVIWKNMREKAIDDMYAGKTSLFYVRRHVCSIQIAQTVMGDTGFNFDLWLAIRREAEEGGNR